MKDTYIRPGKVVISGGGDWSGPVIFAAVAIALAGGISYFAAVISTFLTALLIGTALVAVAMTVLLVRVLRSPRYATIRPGSLSRGHFPALRPGQAGAIEGRQPIPATYVITDLKREEQP